MTSTRRFWKASCLANIEMSGDRETSRRRERSPDDRDRRRDASRDAGRDRGGRDRSRDRTERRREEGSRRDESDRRDKDRRREDSRDRRKDDRDAEKERKRSRSRERDQGRKRDRDRTDDSDREKERKKDRDRKEKDRKKEEKKSKKRKDDSESEEDELTKQARAMVPKISEDDYFARATEFAVWLLDKKGIHAGDLSSKESRRYFAKFVEKWNDFRLSSKYYKGIAPSAAPHVRTTHSWNFKNVSAGDIERARSEVEQTTEGQSGFGNSAAGPSAGPRRVMGPTMPIGPVPTAAPEDSDEETRRFAVAKQARRADRKAQEERLDELAPKETGRERMIEKRRMENAKRRQFDDRDYDVELGDGDLIGGGDDFKARLAARNAAAGRREQARANEAQRRTELNADRFQAMREKDKATMDMLKKMAEERFGGGSK